MGEDDGIEMSAPVLAAVHLEPAERVPADVTSRGGVGKGAQRGRGSVGQTGDAHHTMTGRREERRGGGEIQCFVSAEDTKNGTPNLALQGEKDGRLNG